MGGHRGGAPICTLTLATTAVKDAFALTVQPGCDAAVARLNFTRWRIDRDELMLLPARGNPWRFEEIDAKTWQPGAGKRRPDHAGEAVVLFYPSPSGKAKEFKSASAP